VMDKERYFDIMGFREMQDIYLIAYHSAIGANGGFIFFT